MALLGELSRHSGMSWVSVRNYNRLVLLNKPLRERRFQALRRFGALVAPVLLTARERPRLDARDAWREHDDDVLAAIDQGRDLDWHAGRPLWHWARPGARAAVSAAPATRPHGAAQAAGVD